MNHLVFSAREEKVFEGITLKPGNKITVEYKDGLVETYEIGLKPNFLKDPPIITLDSAMCKAVKGRRLNEWISFPSPKGERMVVVRVRTIGGNHEGA